MKLSKVILKKINKIKLILTDVDGVLTDAGMYYTESGDEFKKFNTRDGMGVKLLKEKGFMVGIVTTENSSIVDRRAKKLNIDMVYKGVEDKRKVFKEIMKQYNLMENEIAYIGEDINDLDIVKLSGFSATVSDGMDIVKKNVDYICKKKGGEGAFREFAELFLCLH